jgi:hypothetical protein
MSWKSDETKLSLDESPLARLKLKLYYRVPCQHPPGTISYLCHWCIAPQVVAAPCQIAHRAGSFAFRRHFWMAGTSPRMPSCGRTRGPHSSQLEQTLGRYSQHVQVIPSDDHSWPEAFSSRRANVAKAILTHEAFLFIFHLIEHC